MKSPLANCGRFLLCTAAVAAAIGWSASSPVAAADPPPGNDYPPNQLCLACHGKPGLTTEVNGQERTLAAVDAAAFEASAHGGRTCVSCHSDQATLPHAPSEPPTQGDDRGAACATCHREAYAGYLESPHGTMAELRDASGPTCSDCHGDVHSVRPVSEWTDEQRAQICAGCHPGAGSSFLRALSHEAPSPRFLRSAYFAGRFLAVLASATLAFGIIHVELDVLRWLARHRRSDAARRKPWKPT